MTKNGSEKSKACNAHLILQVTTHSYVEVEPNCYTSVCSVWVQLLGGYPDIPLLICLQ